MTVPTDTKSESFKVRVAPETKLRLEEVAQYYGWKQSEVVRGLIKGHWQQLYTGGPTSTGGDS